MKRLVTCVLLAGCGGGNGSIAIDDLGTELGIASCGKQFDFCTEVEIMEQYMGLTLDGVPITTEEQCVELTNAIFTGFGVVQYKESLAVGRVEYDGAAAADCIAAIEDMTCAQYSTGELAIRMTDCRPFIVPKVADGGGCTQDFECTSRNCAGATVDPDGPDVDGACQPMPSAGQSCDDNCADGLYCGFDLSANMDVCQPLKADGAQCNSGRECASDECDETRMCATPAPTCDGR